MIKKISFILTFGYLYFTGFFKLLWLRILVRCLKIRNSISFGRINRQ